MKNWRIVSLTIAIALLAYLPLDLQGAVGGKPTVVSAMTIQGTTAVVPNLKVVSTADRLTFVPDLPDDAIWSWDDVTVKDGKAQALLLYTQDKKIKKAVYEVSITGGLAPSPIPTPTPTPTPIPTPVPDSNPYKPTTEYQGACARIVAMTMGKADATSLADAYATVGKDISSATSTVKNLNDLRRALVEKIGTLDLKGKYPGLAEAHDAAMSQLFGTGDPKTLVDKVTAVAKLTTIAWAVWGIGR